MKLIDHFLEADDHSLYTNQNDPLMINYINKLKILTENPKEVLSQNQHSMKVHIAINFHTHMDFVC